MYTNVLLEKLVTPAGLHKSNKINDLTEFVQVFKPVLTRINPVKLQTLFRFILRNFAYPISVTPVTFEPKINFLKVLISLLHN